MSPIPDNMPEDPFTGDPLSVDPDAGGWRPDPRTRPNPQISPGSVPPNRGLTAGDRWTRLEAPNNTTSAGAGGARVPANAAGGHYLGPETGPMQPERQDVIVFVPFTICAAVNLWAAATGADATRMITSPLMVPLLALACAWVLRRVPMSRGKGWFIAGLAAFLLPDVLGRMSWTFNPMPLILVVLATGFVFWEVCARQELARPRAAWPSWLYLVGGLFVARLFLYPKDSPLRSADSLEVGAVIALLICATWAAFTLSRCGQQPGRFTERGNLAAGVAIGGAFFLWAYAVLLIGNLYGSHGTLASPWVVTLMYWLGLGGTAWGMSYMLAARLR